MYRSFLHVIGLILISCTCLVAQDVTGSFDVPLSAGNPEEDPTKDRIEALYRQIGVAGGGINLFTGDAALSIDIDILKLTYSGNIRRIIASPNDRIQSSWVGTGWTLTMGYITADNGGTVGLTDDRYFLVTEDGFSSEIRKINGQYLTEDYKYWKITPQITASNHITGWTITREDGTVYQYGDMFDGIGTNKGNRCSLAWGDWIGNGSSAGAVQVPYQWDLTKVIDTFGNTVLNISYQQETETLNGLSTLYTKASYMSEIVDRTGRKIQLIVGPRDNSEWVDPYTHTSEPDAFMERFETQHLNAIKIYNPANQLVNQYQFTYLPEAAEGGKEGEGRGKQFLMALQQLDANNVALPSHRFEYRGIALSDENYNITNGGELEMIVYPSGGNTKFEYDYTNNAEGITTQTPISLADEFLFELAGSNIFITDEHFVILKTIPPNESFGKTVNLLMAWHWDGNRWQIQAESDAYSGIPALYGYDPESLILGMSGAVFETECNCVKYYAGFTPVLKGYDDKFALIAIQDDEFSSPVNANLWAWHWTGEKWKREFVDTIIINNTTFGTKEPIIEMTRDKMAVFEHFDTNDFGRKGKIKTYSWNGSEWELDDTLTVTPDFIWGVDYPIKTYPVMRMDGHHLVVLDQYWPVWRLSSWYWNGQAWQPSTGLSSTIAGYNNPPQMQLSDGKLIILSSDDPATLFAWRWTGTIWDDVTISGGASSFVMYESFISELSVVDDKLIVLEHTDAEYPETEIDGTTCYLHAWHWDGAQYINDTVASGIISSWSDEYNTTNYFVIKPITTVLKDKIIVFQPEFRGYYGEDYDDRYYTASLRSWHYNKNSSSPTDNNWDAYNGDSFISRNYTWVHHPNVVPYMSAASDGTSDLIITLSQEVTQEPIYSYNQPYKDLRAYRWTGMEWDTLNLRYDRDFGVAPFLVSSGNHFIVSQGTIGGDPTFLPSPYDTLLAFADYNDTWAGLDGDEVRDYRIIKKITDDSMGNISETIIDYKNGVYDINAGTAQYNKVKITLPGSSGFSESYFYNDLGPTELPSGTPWVDVASDLDESEKHFKELDGKLYLTRDFTQSANPGVDSPVQSAQTQHSLFEKVPEYAIYHPRVVQSTTTLDALETTISYEHDDDNGLAWRTIETNSNNVRRVTETKFAHDQYSAMQTANMLSQVVQETVYEYPDGISIPVNLDPVRARAATVTTWKFWPQSNNGWAPVKMYRWREDDVSYSQPTFDFVNWADVNEPSGSHASEWIRTSRVLSRDTFGNILQTDDARQISSATVWGYNASVPVAKLRNTSPSQAAVSIFDDNSTAGWVGVNGTWAITNGVYQQTDANNTNVWTNPKRYDNVSLDDAILEADVRFDDDVVPRLVAIYKQLDTYSYVRFELRRTPSGTFARIQPVKAGTASEYSEIATPLNANQWYHLRGEIQGSVARLYVDGQLLIKFDHADNDLDGTKIGLGMWKSIASFDNVRFYPPNALVTSVSFDPGFFKINTKTDESGISTIFTYDAFGRLETIQDRAGNLLREADYFYSSPFSASNPNHVQEKVYRSGTEFTINRTYADGLGRPVQTQQNEGTGSVKTGTIYDDLGRVKRVTKPFYDNGSQAFNTNPVSAAQTYYSNNHPVYYDGPSSQQFDTGQYPYAETEYFADPLDRVKRQAAPGTAFYMGSGKEVKLQYLTNTSTDLPNDYPTANVLLKQSREDENSYRTDTFHDRFGNLVATIASPNSLKLTTVHSYDVLGNLIQTKAPAASPTNLTSTYLYNTLSQLISKSTPDAAAVEYKYDKNGNLRFVKDGKGSDGNTYFIYYKYDAFNRKIEEGTMANPSTNFNQANADNASYPTSNHTVKVKYHYDFAGYNPGMPQKNLAGRMDAIEYLSERFTQSTAPKGYIFYSYDDRGRVEWIENWIPKSNQNDGNGSLGTRTQYEYDFQGNVTKTYFRRLFPPGANSNTFYVWYDYDEVGRLKKVFANTADNKPATAEAEYSYWPGGQLKRLVLGNNVQGLDYLYNSRDWLTQINHQNLLHSQDPGGDGGGGGVAIPDRFGQIIGYNEQAHIAHSSTPFAGDFVAQYNGNISWTIHNTFDNDDLSSLTGWVFKYDPVNRLTKANWGHYTSAWVEPTSRYDLLNITYDASGNLTHMKRRMYNAAGIDMFYHYKPNSNQLDYVENLNSQTSGNYSYDANGNLTADIKKLASAGVIAYNYRNLPTQVPMPGGAIAFDYDGNGQRISKNDIIYVTDAAGRTLAAYDLNGTHLYWNIWGLDLIGQRFYAQ